MRRVVMEADLAVRPGAVAYAKAELPAKAGLVPDDYTTRVLKLIPAEIVAVFVTVNGILKAVTSVSVLFEWCVFLLLVVMTFLYTWRAATVKGLPPAYLQIAISTIAFGVWVFALGGPFVSLEWYNPAYGSVLLIIFTLFPPMFVK